MASGDLGVDLAPGEEDVVEHGVEGLALGGEAPELPLQPPPHGAQHRAEDPGDVQGADEAGRAGLDPTVSPSRSPLLGQTGGTDFPVHVA